MVLDKNTSFAKILAQGATIQELNVNGHNIVLGFSSAHAYTFLNGPYFGETIGRCANRIKSGVVKNVNGRDYQLAQNDGRNHLHGGPKGWGKRTFNGPEHVNRHGREAVQFTYVSPDGEEGYPGTVELRVWYTTSEEVADNITKHILDIEYEVELIGKECEQTPINITNHSYFNITGAPTIEGTEVVLSTDLHLPVDAESLPLETIEEHPVIKANKPFTLEKEQPDVDHCFIMDTNTSEIPIDTRERELKRLVSASSDSTRLHLEVYSTEPAFQFYTGRYINVPASEYGPARTARSGFCVEPSRYIDAVNRPAWRNMVVLQQGQKYGSRTRYVAWQV